VPRTPAILRPRSKSLLRGVLLAFIALAASLLLEGFPHTGALHASHWQILVVPVAFGAMIDTFRCLGRYWSLYHVGVLILLYSELMILALALFFWLYPL
jgi:hypothetical protein